MAYRKKTIDDLDPIWSEALSEFNGKKEPPVKFFEPIWPLIGSKLWVAGGSVNRWLEGRTQNQSDIDLFSPDPDKLGLKLNEQFRLMGGNLERESRQAWTWRVGTKEIQLVKRAFDSLPDTLRSFDFTARMVGMDGESVFMHPNAKMDILNKQIVYHNRSESTVSSLHGMMKYANRGYQLDFANAHLFLKAWGVPEENRELAY